MNIIQPEWPAPANIRALTTTRKLWGEVGTADTAERTRLISLLNLPSDPIWLKQTHSTIALPANNSNRSQEADASYTSQPNQVSLVLTADCLPLLICDRQGSTVAAIHAGWRGLAAGIIENTIKALKLNPEDVLVWLGPAIGPDKFEVGDDVYHAFTDHDPDSISAFKPSKPGKWLANLYQLATVRLNRLGITHLYGGNHCTHTEQDLFFSWRRDQNKATRLASMIWIEK
tara:strand:+ start:507 stop:1196 length:690 start_codon:yes stop_codon:yes gene_type:complete